MKICQTCGYMGEEDLCPTCRKAGKIKKLRTTEQLNHILEAMRRDAMHMKDCIKRLEGA